MSVRATRARVFDAAIGPTRADIPHLGVAHPLLTIEGEAAGATADFVRFVDASPVGEWTGHFTDGVQATGNGKLALKFTLPLGKGDGVKVAGDYQFVDNQLRLAGVPALAQVGGHLVFTEATMQSRDLVADVFGGTVKIGVTSDDGRVRIAANGTSNLATLRGELDSPWLARVGGHDRLAGDRGHVDRRDHVDGRVEPEGRDHRPARTDRQDGGGDRANQGRAPRGRGQGRRGSARRRLPQRVARDRASHARQGHGHRRPRAAAAGLGDRARRRGRPPGRLGARPDRRSRPRRVARVLPEGNGPCAGGPVRGSRRSRSS